MTDLDRFEEDVAAFEQSVGGARAVLSEFSGEMRSMQSTVSDTKREVSTLSNGISRGLKSSFEGLIFDGKKLSDALSGVAKSTLGAAYRSAVSPLVGQASTAVSGGISGMLQKLMPFANGGVLGSGRSFTASRIQPFASGGVVDQATTFPMRNGMGLLGEAGPEAILPLSRGADGRLGVRAGGSAQSPVQVVMNISTPDAQSFRRSQTQIAAQMGRALTRGSRNS